MTVPAGIERAVIRRVSPVMTAIGTLDARGRPDPAVYKIDETLTVREDWGYLRVYAGGVDVTFLRDVPTEIREYGYLEPFGYGPAVLAFPQISPFDTLGAGDLDWLVQGFNVDLHWEDPVTGDIDLDPLWEGLAGVWHPEANDKGYTFVVPCLGALQQAQHEPMQPSFTDELVDVGAALKAAYDGVPARRWATFPAVTTTRGTRNRGSWQSVHDYAQEVLSTAYNADGTRQWTIGCDTGRQPTLHQKDMTTVHWHLAVGTPGAVLDEQSDIGSAPNVIFGEGVLDGGRWRNSRYPDEASGNPPVFVPLASVSENMPFTYDSDGNPTANPSFDPDRLRVARYENMGDGISKAEGTASALGELGRDVNPGWYGTLTLDIDPEEGSRRDIRAGQNIALRHHHGNPTRLFHIAEVKVDHSNNQVALTIDTNARDWITLEGLIKRDREAATDPARRLNPPRRRSRQTPDSHPVFDTESSAGIIPATALTADVWNIIRIPAARYGTINVTAMLTASSATKFAAGVFGQEPTTTLLDTHVGNPITGPGWDIAEAHYDVLVAAGWLMSWGTDTELAGYSPQAGDGTHPVTGRLDDDGPWDFISTDPPWLWVVVFPDLACTLTGRLYVAPET